MSITTLSTASSSSATNPAVTSNAPTDLSVSNLPAIPASDASPVSETAIINLPEQISGAGIILGEKEARALIPDIETALGQKLGVKLTKSLVTYMQAESPLTLATLNQCRTLVVDPAFEEKGITAKTLLTNMLVTGLAPQLTLDILDTAGKTGVEQRFYWFIGANYPELSNVASGDRAEVYKELRAKLRPAEIKSLINTFAEVMDIANDHEFSYKLAIRLYAALGNTSDLRHLAQRVRDHFKSNETGDRFFSKICHTARDQGAEALQVLIDSFDQEIDVQRPYQY